MTVIEMESGINNAERSSVFSRVWMWLRGLVAKLAGSAMHTKKIARDRLAEIATQTKKVAEDDPRRLIHSLKVGLALALVSLFYYIRPLHSNFGIYAIWAVITVIVVFEFTVGATLGKGLNRALATLAGGVLGLGAQYAACATGETCEPVMIVLFVFLQAAVSTFVRFFPKVKAKYDYGMAIFTVTFSLVSMSRLRTEEILELANNRLLTILIGGLICVIVSTCVCPVWAGEDLHKLVAKNIDKLGTFLEGFADECFRTSEESENGKSKLVSLDSVLDSANSVETLANYASWEPGHGKFMYRHPWKQYLKIASLTKQCACRVESLEGYLNSKTQPPEQIRGMISSMSSECGKALKELALAIEKMTKPPSPNPHIPNLKVASENLSCMLKSQFSEEHGNLVEIMPLAAVACLLNDTVTRVENLARAVDELSALANFKSKEEPHGEEEENNSSKTTLGQAVDKGNNDISHVVIVVDGDADKEGQSSVQVGHENLGQVDRGNSDISLVIVVIGVAGA